MAYRTWSAASNWHDKDVDVAGNDASGNWADPARPASEDSHDYCLQKVTNTNFMALAVECVNLLPNRGSATEISQALSDWNLSISNNPIHMPESHDVQPVAAD